MVLLLPFLLGHGFHAVPSPQFPQWASKEIALSNKQRNTPMSISLEHLEQAITLANVVNEAAGKSNPQAILFIREALKRIEKTKQQVWRKDLTELAPFNVQSNPFKSSMQLRPFKTSIPLKTLPASCNSIEEPFWTISRRDISNRTRYLERVDIQFIVYLKSSSTSSGTNGITCLERKTLKSEGT